MRTMVAGMSIRKQKGDLSAAGFDFDDEYVPVHLDDRDAAIASMAPGDVLVVASASCLGYPEHDILSALAEIGRRGASVLDLETGEEIQWHPEMQKVADFAERGGSATRKAIAAKARKARVESGNLGGVPAADRGPQQTKRLKAMLAEGKLSRKEMAQELGMSRATLQRWLRDDPSLTQTK